MIVRHLVFTVALTAMLGLTACSSAASTPDDVAADDLDAAVLEVEGMTCMSCVQGIESELTDHEAVATAEVDFDDEKVVVGYDGAELEADHLVEIVDDLGYTVELVEH